MRPLVLAALLVSACAEAPDRLPCAEAPRPSASASSPSAALDGAALDGAVLAGAALDGAAAGALVYVPAYSHVYSGDRQQRVDLAATLSIRNTDARGSLRVVSVHYVGSRGETLRAYLDAPRTLGPYATADFVVGQSDREGGSGASFIVAWTADAPVSAPVVEAVMINTSGQQGISFVTEGRVVAEAVGS